MDIIKKNKSDSLDERVNNQAIDFIFEWLPDANRKQLLLPFLFVTALWQTQPHIHLITWASLVILANILKIILAKLYLKYRNDYKSPLWWVNLYVVSSGITGLLWGYAAFTFYSTDSIGEQVLIITFVLGLATATSYLTSYWLKSFYAWSYPLFLAMIYRLYSEGTIEYIILTIAFIINLIVLTKMAKQNNASILDSIKLRFENTALIENLKKEKEKAEEANRAKTKFLAAASHDLRQPLHALNLFTGLLKHHSTEKIQKELLKKVDSSLLGLNVMLDKLLDISRLDAGVLEKNIQNFNLREVLDSLTIEYENQFSEKGLRFETNYTDCHVKTDPVLIEGILRNLLSNALRYTDSGTVSLICQVADVHDKESVTIQVKDTGIGIKEENLNEIFSEYTQLNNPERDQSKGLGLGLAIVKRISNLIGAKLKVKSEYGFGSLFELTIQQGIQIIRRQEKTNIENNLNLLSVIFIDDDEAILSGMNEMLLVWGCQVLAVASAEEAIKYIRETDFIPDVIISDYRLREGRTGAEAIKAISNLFDSDIPAYIITGDTDPARLKEALASGYELLHKPLKPEKIKEILNTLNNNDLRQERG